MTISSATTSAAQKFSQDPKLKKNMCRKSEKCVDRLEILTKVKQNAKAKVPLWLYLVYYCTFLLCKYFLTLLSKQLSSTEWLTIWNWLIRLILAINIQLYFFFFWGGGRAPFGYLYTFIFKWTRIGYRNRSWHGPFSILDETEFKPTTHWS